MLGISKDQAQRFILEKQGLLTNSPSKSILDVAKRIHNIQIDTNSVVARSQDLTLYNRLTDYHEGQIWKLLEEKKLFEFWSHGICLMPIEEYPFYAWKMEYKKKNPANWWRKWLPENQDVIKNVYKYVKKNGPTRSADFEREEERKSEGWWDWKKEKLALELLFDQGKLLIAFRKNFQKFYDISERVIPSGIKTEPLADDELADYLIQTVLSSLGLASYEELRHYIGMVVSKYLWKNNRKSAMNYLQDCVDQDKLIEIKIENQDVKHFILKEDESKLRKMNYNFDQNTPMKFLTPFDNAIRDRDLPLRIWGFDYKIECYTPAKDRIFGYFTLPILDGYSLIGRTDLKAHRKDSILEIKSIHFEDWFKHSEESFKRLAKGLSNFAEFHNCSKIQAEESIPNKIRKSLLSSLDSAFLT
ncbi:MAG: YcaQ family DNA glycosylase [Candidatus Heimdallarchaeota archaeon]|nr:YcaQ family DNA glycosylase [Candidatus Heimdallarchaeota archaeon]MBY8994476.1 YcaQ family DNA glycosylase [Candidatus Heimdallarchaeota archaeon]